jgi:hypothetical protein
MIANSIIKPLAGLALLALTLPSFAQDKPAATPQAAPQAKPTKAEQPAKPAPAEKPANALEGLDSLDDLLAPAGDQTDKKTPVQEGAQDKTANDLDSLLGLPGAKQITSGDKGADSGTEAGKNIFDDLMNIPENEGGDDFDSAVANMTQAASRLTNDNDLSLDTQRHQQSAILSLDKMITELNKQQNSKKKQKKQQKKDQGQEGNESKPSQPGEQQQQQQSTQATEQAGEQGQIEEGELNGDAPLAEKLAEWGNLPPHLRDELMQGFEDRFSELYRHLTEQYYKRLAEESQ